MASRVKGVCATDLTANITLWAKDSPSLSTVASSSPTTGMWGKSSCSSAAQGEGEAGQSLPGAPVKVPRYLLGTEKVTRRGQEGTEGEKGLNAQVGDGNGGAVSLLHAAPLRYRGLHIPADLAGPLHCGNRSLQFRAVLGRIHSPATRAVKEKNKRWRIGRDVPTYMQIEGENDSGPLFVLMSSLS